MRSKMQKLVVGVFISIFIGNIEALGSEAKKIKLSQENKKIYGVSENKIGKEREDYWLKVKLKPKIIPERVYWRGQEKINWQSEIKNWDFGFLSQNENLPPIIIYKENFYPVEEEYRGRFRWMSNNARLLVINPLEVPVRVNFIFEASSYKKERELEIWVNGRKV
jgi:hypothetical protein